MCHTSPASYLVWSLCCGLLFSFLLFHLWSFDRFRCLKWNQESGAFKRVMTYSYLLTIPLIMVYSLGFCIIKYREGYAAVPFYGIIPKPYQLWEKSSQNAIFPLTLVFSFGWSLEMVTHLEELCFWLFLINSVSVQRSWFRSPYFKTWVVGSCVALIYMPLINILTRSDPLRSEAITFLAGSIGSLSLTLGFLPILWVFPTFLNNLRRESVDINTVVRLTKFHELNTIRVAFRFLFAIPLFILGVDGVRPVHVINEILVWTDFLAMLAAFGVIISSGITLVIFFPRSIEAEIAAKDASRQRKLGSTGYSTSIYNNAVTTDISPSMIESQSQPTYLLTSSPVKQFAALPREDTPATDFSIYDKPYWEDAFGEDNTANLPPLRPNRRIGNAIELGGIVESAVDSNPPAEVREAKKAHRKQKSKKLRKPVNPFISNFKSPIDLM